MESIKAATVITEAEENARNTEANRLKLVEPAVKLATSEPAQLKSSTSNDSTTDTGVSTAAPVVSVAPAAGTTKSEPVKQNNDSTAATSSAVATDDQNLMPVAQNGSNVLNPLDATGMAGITALAAAAAAVASNKLPYSKKGYFDCFLVCF